MNLDCLNNIITTNLAVQIDISKLKSWNLNADLTTFSITKWNDAVSDNINLIDFGLTAFDNGRTNIMWSGITLTPQDNLFSMYRVGYNDVYNPINTETSGITAITQYLPISAITTSTAGNYFDLNGGYLQGFFKLNGYNYELLPSRYNDGITIETLLYLYPNSSGIFYMMGARAEDKYNPYFSGEIITGNTTIGVVSSSDNYLDAIISSEILKESFSTPENNTNTIYTETDPINNIKNNVIAFEITTEGNLSYKYVDDNGVIVNNSSLNIITATGFTLISIVFTPYSKITDIDLLYCTKQRRGDLVFYVNGRTIWAVKDFPEFYFKSFTNNNEKQLGVPYSISWGGGSFGLQNSWHYDYQTYIIYSGQNSNYINSKFFVTNNPLPNICRITSTGDTYLSGLSLSANSTTFIKTDTCNPTVQIPVTVMCINYTGSTGNTYFVRFNQPISVISNRDYTVNLSVYNNNFFMANTDNKLSILAYSNTVDINVIDDTEYMYPLPYNINNIDSELHKFNDAQEYEYILNGVMYYGVSGLEVTQQNSLIQNSDTIMANNDTWLPMTSIFRSTENSGQNNIYLGLLIETDGIFNTGGTLYVKDFTYTAADILVQDERKDNLLIEQNFNTSFIGGIQKLRIYDMALTSPEILHNALFEANLNSDVIVNKGGRIIHR